MTAMLGSRFVFCLFLGGGGIRVFVEKIGVYVRRKLTCFLQCDSPCQNVCLY